MTLKGIFFGYFSRYVEFRKAFGFCTGELYSTMLANGFNVKLCWDVLHIVR